MKKSLAIVIVCVGIMSLVLGTAGFSFAGFKTIAEDVDDTSQMLTYDISSISIFAFCVKDFFEGATEFQFELAGYGDENLNPTGAWFVIYRSYKNVQVGDNTLGELVREEQFPLSSAENPMTEAEASEAFQRIRYPLKPFLDWERSQYDGAFADVVNVLQYCAYIFGMIWGVLSLVLLVVIDTITTAWELIGVAMRFVGLM